MVYDGLSNNCVQVSMKVLLKGTFYEDYMIYEDRMRDLLGLIGGKWPNNAFDFIRFG